jgi:hypothetical protein
MDPTAFDRLTCLLAGSVSRRRTLVSALFAGVGATRLGAGETAAKRGKRPGGNRRRSRAKDRVGSQAASQCGNPGPGQPLRRCDYSGRDLVGIDLHSAMLRQAKFVDADLCGANLTSAHLRDADLRDANLTRAILRSASFKGAKTAGAVFCETIMPDGTTNDSGCVEGATICCFDGECAADEICLDGICQPECEPDLTPCNGECVDLETNFDHCGACDDPCDAETADSCAGGACRCGTGGACTAEGEVCTSCGFCSNPYGCTTGDDFCSGTGNLRCPGNGSGFCAVTDCGPYCFGSLACLSDQGFTCAVCTPPSACDTDSFNCCSGPGGTVCYNPVDPPQ